jgi:hypothetical protein
LRDERRLQRPTLPCTNGSALVIGSPAVAQSFSGALDPR